MAKPVGTPGKGNVKADGTSNNGKNSDSGDNGAIVGTDGNDVLIGTDGNDTILGGAGDDILVGGMGMDYLDGGDGSDTYVVYRYADWDTFLDSGTGEGDYDVMVAGDHYATFYLSEFSDANGIEEISSGGFSGVKIMGDWGDNTYDFSNTVVDDVEIWTSAGNDTVYGSQGDDYIHAGDGNDVLFGNGGNDTLIGSFGSDTMSGGSGSDTFVYNSVGEGGDVIVDFDTGSSGDVLDLSTLIAIEDGSSVSLEQNGADATVVVTLSDSSTVDLVTLSDVDVSSWDDANLMV